MFPLKIDTGNGIGRAQISPTRCRRQVRNQRASPAESAIVTDGITAIDRAAVGKAAFLKGGDKEIRIYLRPRDVRLGLRTPVGWKSCGIVAKAQVRADSQIEQNTGRWSRQRRRRGRRRGRSLRPGNGRTHQVIIMIQQHQRAG